MITPFLPANPEIRQVFTASIHGLGAHLHDTVDDGESLFLRAVFPDSEMIKPRDRVRGGVALFAFDQEVTICPYVLRQICSNGLLLAQATQSRRIQRANFAASSTRTSEILEELHESVYQCARGGSFEQSVQQMREAVAIRGEMELVLTRVATLARQGEIPDHVLKSLVRRLKRRSNPSRFDLMNVVTRMARDVSEPKVRWRLEELGGGVLAPTRPKPRPKDSARKATGEVELEAEVEEFV